MTDEEIVEEIARLLTILLISMNEKENLINVLLKEATSERNNRENNRK